MKYKNKNKYGFTLVELLVVIAIIGILSTVAITSLNSTKEKARDAVVKDSLNSILRSVELCLHGEGSLTNPVSGTDICNNNSYNQWPDLTENNWAWGASNSNADANTFCFQATKNNSLPMLTIRCQENGCQELSGPIEMPNPCNPVGPTP